MNDPTFGAIEFSIDSWDGLAPFEFPPSRTERFAVHVWADEDGPTPAQRALFDGLKARYAEMWPQIADALLKCHGDLGSVDKVGGLLNPTVGCYIEDEEDGGEPIFELVYRFDRDSDEGRAFFVRVNNWAVAEAVVAG